PEYTIAYTGNYTTSADANYGRGRFGQGDRQHAVLQAGFAFVLLDAARQADMPFEPAIAALRIAARHVGRLELPFASDRQDIIVDAYLHVLFVEAGQFRRNANLLVRFRKFDVGPVAAAPSSLGRGKAEAVEDIVDQAVHF